MPEQAAAEGAGGGGARATQEAVAALWERFRGSLLARLDTIERAVLALMEGGLDDALRREAEREAHKLTGAAGTFGIPEASHLARRLEQAFEPGALLEPQDALRLSELAVGLRQELVRGPARVSGAAGGEAGPAARGTIARGGAAPAPPAAADCPRVLLVEGDQDLADRMVIEATGRGLQPEVVGDAGCALAALAAADADVVVLDLDLCGPIADARLGAADSGVPLIVLASDGSFETRLTAARMGSDVFLMKPVAPSAVMNAAADLCSRSALAEGSRILAVDDDPLVLRLLQKLLSAHGVRVVGVAEPLSFWDALEQNPPDLLILDLDMPGLNGLELCRVVRSDSRWRRLPVIVLSSRIDSVTVQQVFEAGADDFVRKPIMAAELWARISNRLERLTIYSQSAGVDDLTGTASRSSGEATVRRVLRLARRAGERVAIGLVEVADLKGLNGRHGQPAGDRVLRRVGELLQNAFGGEDVVARWDGAAFLVAMQGFSCEEGASRLDVARRRIGAELFVGQRDATFRVTCLMGVAEFPEHGTDLTVVTGAASVALEQSRLTGGERVECYRGADGEAAAVEAFDVVVIEDDDAVAELLVHALTTRGYSVLRLADGQAAVDRLSRGIQPVQARVVLLDVGLPGLDGLSVLRALAAAGVTRKMRVLMLTARSAELEVVKALELGAFDHIAKPFSVPVLMERLRRAMGER